MESRNVKIGHTPYQDRWPLRYNAWELSGRFILQSTDEESIRILPAMMSRRLCELSNRGKQLCLIEKTIA